MIPQLAAAKEIQDFIHQQGWRVCMIGAMAVMRWGEPRTTQDVDMTLLTGFAAEEDYIRPLLRQFQPLIPHAEQFAVRNRVLRLKSHNDVEIDISLGGLPYEELMIERSSPFEFESGCSIITCSAEDLVVLKSFAGRDKDWLDVEGILIRQQGKLDWKYINEQLTFLCELKEAPELVSQLLQRKLRLEETSKPGRKSKTRL